MMTGDPNTLVLRSNSNKGAEATSGPLLLFLHTLFTIVAKYSIVVYGVLYMGPKYSYRVVEVLVVRRE